MRLALADVPKTFTRRDGRVFLLPRLLRPADLRAELAALVALYEASLGQRRADFPADRPAEILSDFRLARCLTLCLGDWYSWASAAWPGAATLDEATALAQRDITDPTALRLALYDFAQAACGGYLPTSERDALLDQFAASQGITRTTLDALLALDDPREARLLRLAGEIGPSAAELAARYNQRAVEALLSAASLVEWRVPPEAAEHAGGGLGAVVKQVCFLARRMGVNYEVAFEYGFPDLASSPVARVAERPAGYIQPGPRSLDAAGLPVVITLSGPQELVGAPNQYGERLTRLCRALLGYRRADNAGALRGALTGSATVYLHGKPFNFTLDDRLLRLLRTETLAGEASAIATDVAFDSSLERRLYEDFRALERAGEAAGWRLEREPEPLLFGETILIPDFALTRDQRRIYLEVAGYWRPEYRERKARKLLALDGAIPLVVAAPESARGAFGALEARYPFVWYMGEALSAPALLATLLRAYDDFPARLASLDLPRLLAETQRRGHIAPIEAQAALHSFTRDEVAFAVAALAAYATEQELPAPEWLEGLGLCAPDFLASLTSATLDAVTIAGGARPLAEVGAALASLAPAESLTEATLDTLCLRAGLVVSRASLFSAMALTPERATADAAAEPLAEANTPPDAARRKSRAAQPRKGVRRTSSGVTWSAPAMFPPERASEERGTEADSLPPPPATE